MQSFRGTYKYVQQDLRYSAVLSYCFLLYLCVISKRLVVHILVDVLYVCR